MRRGTRHSFFGLLLLLLSAAPAAYARDLPRPETFTLSNGMQVVVITDRRAPVVTIMVWYRVGAADEPRGHSGMAHFFEHLMFKGTRASRRGEFSPIIARNGGDDNAFTSWDYTAFYERIARDRLELVMGMEADRMRNLQLPDIADRVRARRHHRRTPPAHRQRSGRGVGRTHARHAASRTIPTARR